MTKEEHDKKHRKPDRRLEEMFERIKNATPEEKAEMEELRRKMEEAGLFRLMGDSED